MLTKLHVSVIILLLALPLLIQYVIPYSAGSLDGVERSVAIDSASWWNGTLQKKTEQTIRDSSKLFASSVRLKNQLEFSLFDKINAQDLYYYNGTFYRFTYPAYNETHEFLSPDTIQHRVAILKAFSEEMKIPVYVIITPNKMRLYPENLPSVNRITSTNTNYFHYKKALKKAGVPILDAHEWMFQKRKQFRHPVISKLGVHWTQYGAGLTFDSLIKRVSIDRKLDLQRLDPQWAPKGTFYPQDIDLANLSNLMITPHQEENLVSAAFPEDRVKKRQLRAMLLSDSFFHAISWSGMDRQILDPRTTFYYYYHTRFDQKLNSNPINHDQIKHDLEGIDCLILLTDIQNLSNFGFGFLDDYAKKELENKHNQLKN